MADRYTVTEASQLVGLAAKTVRARCASGMVNGAEFRAGQWWIPAAALPQLRRRRARPTSPVEVSRR